MCHLKGLFSIAIFAIRTACPKGRISRKKPHAVIQLQCLFKICDCPVILLSFRKSEGAPTISDCVPWIEPDRFGVIRYCLVNVPLKNVRRGARAVRNDETRIESNGAVVVLDGLVVLG